MKTYRVKVEVVFEIDAFTPSDAEDIVLDVVQETDGLGVNVINSVLLGTIDMP